MPRRHLTEWAAWAAHHEDWLSPEGEAAAAAASAAAYASRYASAAAWDAEVAWDAARDAQLADVRRVLDQSPARETDALAESGADHDREETE
jgi:HD superfamily phosphodiesterase